MYELCLFAEQNRATHDTEVLIKMRAVGEGQSTTRFERRSASLYSVS
jgi:hypothetical protein